MRCLHFSRSIQNISLACLAGLGLSSLPDPARAGEPGQAVAQEIGLKFGEQTTVISGPLKANGLPDYVEYLNQKLGDGVAPGENFWVLMWEAVGNAENSSPAYLEAVGKKLGIRIDPQQRLIDIGKANGVTGEAVTPLHDQMTKTHAGPWKRSDYPAVARWLDANADAMRLVEEASRRSKAFSPLVSNSKPELIGVLLPHVQRVREVARLLESRAMLRLQEGDADGAWNDLITIYRISRHVESGFTLIERLVAVAVRSMASEAMAQWLSRTEMSTEQLEARWKELAPLLVTDSFATSVQLERLMFADVAISLRAGECTLQQLQGDINVIGGAGSVDSSWLADAGSRFWKGTEEALSRLAISSIDVNATLRVGNGVYDDMVAAMSPANHLERAAKLKDVDEQVKAMTESIRSTSGLLTELLLAPKEEASELPGRILVSLLVPAVAACERAQTSSEARAATLEAAFRLRIAAQKAGTIPDSFESIVGGEKPLLDPFTGKPLAIRTDERGIVISSVGPNGKDEQGRRNDEQPGADDLRTILVLP